MKYTNPVIKGFNPDPSICRVGKDYYLVTSSFEYFPGIPIYHSVDLINWEQIGNCIDRIDQLPMSIADSSGGIWAPTIRYNNGKFYITATFSEKGNFIISADEPGGDWSDAVWVEMDGIDPSMFFENGTMYYCANDCGSRQCETEGISLARVDVDSGKVIGEIKRIWEGAGGGFLEAPHIYHIGKWYYLIAAEGGTSLNHMTTLARSRDIWGPYENSPDNPILTNRNDTSKQALCCGHADLVEDCDSNLWLLHLGTRPAVGSMSNLGRETFLTPATLSDGWIKAVGGKARINNDAPVKSEQILSKETAFDFNNHEWEHQWLFLRQPDMKNYQRKDGCLILKPTNIKITDKKSSPTFMAVRQPDFKCNADISFEFEPMEKGDEAGAAVYLTPDFMYRIFKRRKEDGSYLIVQKTADDFNETAFCGKIPDGTVNIKISADKKQYSFYYSVDDNDMKLICNASTRFLTCELAGKCFTGVVIGIYAQSELSTGALAKYHNFKISQV